MEDCLFETYEPRLFLKEKRQNVIRIRNKKTVVLFCKYIKCRSFIIITVKFIIIIVKIPH